MVYFIRHGATDWNDNINNEGKKDPKCQGRADIPINARGVQQANIMANLLKDITFDRIICSPLLRAVQTAQIISNNKQIEIDNRLIERDFGEFEGLTRNQFDFCNYWNKHSHISSSTGESIDNIKDRLYSLINELKLEPQKNILIVSHGGVGCVFSGYFKGEPSDGNYLKYEIPHCQPEIFNFNQN